MDNQTNELINNEIKSNEVCLFMKGTPDAPQCGFSMAVTNILKMLEVNFKGVKIFPLQGLVNKFEYFFGEDQGRYIIEIKPEHLENVENMLKKESIHFDKLGLVEGDKITLENDIKLSIDDIKEGYKKWLKEYMVN